MEMDNTKTYFRDMSAQWTSRYQQEPKNIWDLDLILRRENVHRIVRDLLKNSESKLKVLDVGCGTGDALDGISRQQVEVRGFDMVAEMVAVASQNHREDHYEVRDIKELPLERQKRNLVLCLGVVEYLDNSRDAISGMYEELVEGGSLLVSFPNNRCLLRHLTRAIVYTEQNLATLVRTLQGRKRRTLPSQYSHTSRSPNSVKAELTQCGFVIERVYFNTFAIGGRVGSFKPLIKLSRWLTHKFYSSDLIGELFAMTMVIHAKKKPEPN